MAVEKSLRSEDPEEIGGYRLTGRIGEGGQGIVYLAERAGRPGGPVALKVPHGAPADGEAIDFAEIAIIQQVARFCTAKILDAGVDGERPYIVSEYIDGPSLQIGRVRRAAARALERLAVGTATALAAIHAAGVVHRDFKPHNVLLAADGPRVVDFGVATTLGRSGEEPPGRSGTPRYMAPEQARGGPSAPPPTCTAGRSR